MTMHFVYSGNEPHTGQCYQCQYFISAVTLWSLAVKMLKRMHSIHPLTMHKVHMNCVAETCQWRYALLCNLYLY